jgi:hypothetical protein
VSTFETVKMALFEMSDLKMSPHSIHFVAKLFTFRRKGYSALNISTGKVLGPMQGCQMVCFQTKIPIWVNFGGP